jgi:pyruvate ferredoxin oxidoreductase gamma subunit
MGITTPNLQKILTDGVLEIRGDGRAGSGMLLTLQSVAAVAVTIPQLYVQEWPFFSSARKGAPTRGFLRLSYAPIQKASEVTTPQIAIAMDEGVLRMVDFAQGVAPDGIFIVNTPKAPEEVAQKYHLSGRVYTIAGDQIAARFMRSALGNISVFALLTEILPEFTAMRARHELEKMLAKRRLPKPIIHANCDVFDASLGQSQVGDFTIARPSDHQNITFHGYGELAPGAQSRLRLSRTNLTSAYARTGFSLQFSDPKNECNGCGHCIINCPENIIEFVPDDERGVRVTGADIGHYCKLCRECIAVCPKQLFTEVANPELEKLKL